MANYLFFLIVFCSSYSLQAQQNFYVNGKVTDEAGNPVAGCSVYFSNTSRGDVTSSSGAFILKNLPEGKYDLVISAIGYQTQVINVSSESYPHDLKITLHMQSTELSAVTVQPYDADTWRRWGPHFIQNFIGTTLNANQCRIVNYKAVRFRYSEKNKKLTASATEPLIIENRALGYTIRFQLEEFSSDLNTNIVYFTGYPFFQEKKKGKKQSIYKKNRQLAYYGSLMHFMRCVYSDQLEANGFTVKATVTRVNAEKQRIKKIMGQRGSKASQDDSTGYYKKVMKQQDMITETIVMTSLDSLITTAKKTKRLFFENRLDVIYKRVPTRRFYTWSEIFLQTPAPIEIHENGSYYSPTELVTTKNWNLNERMSNMLPFDYIP